VWSAGVKAMTYWKTQECGKNKCLYGDHPRTSFACVTTDDQGMAYGGGSNSLIYVYNGNSIK
jgi:hypothetical protein